MFKADSAAVINNQNELNAFKGYKPDSVPRKVTIHADDL
jgi:hypothetical protein